jgi:hypothetical protein
MAETTPVDFYVIGGTLRFDAPCYVERQADYELLDCLRKGQFCYLLTSRQMGKSSLMVRAAQKLRAEGVHIAVLDLTAIGQNLTPEQWYDGLAVRLGRQLHLEEELEAFWQANQGLGPCQRLFSALRDVVLPRLSGVGTPPSADPVPAGSPHNRAPSTAVNPRRPTGQLVIFVDEIDVVRSLPFSTDEFFAAIRQCYTGRAEDTELQRLTFCLLGVATPSDLIKDVRMTPFNIARRIELRDFQEAEAQPLAQALGRPPFVARRLLRRVLYWTGGHPFLTQRLCQAVAKETAFWRTRGVDRICREIFLSHRAREKDDNLLFVRDRLLKADADRVRLLRLYRKVHRTTKITGVFRLGFGLERLAPVADEETNPLVSVLRLSGITREERGILKVRNRIYYLAFDRDWILANMPEVELWRVWVMFLTGLKKVVVLALRVLLVLLFLSLAISFLPGFLRNMRFWFGPPGPPPLEAHVTRAKPSTPPREPTTPANLIDLSAFYNASLKENWHGGTGGSLAALPAGLQVFADVPFDVRGIVQLARRESGWGGLPPPGGMGGHELSWQGYPRRVQGIPVGRRCERLRFLHATGWQEEIGRPIASYVVHYTDGQRRFVPVIYGQDVFDWYPHESNPGRVAGATVAWESRVSQAPGSPSVRRLYLTSWINPRPDVEIRSLDFVSFLTQAAPFLVAITAEP